jgi:hypothetical protein
MAIGANQLALLNLGQEFVVGNGLALNGGDVEPLDSPDVVEVHALRRIGPAAVVAWVGLQCVQPLLYSFMPGSP